MQQCFETGVKELLESRIREVNFNLLTHKTFFVSKYHAPVTARLVLYVQLSNSHCSLGGLSTNTP